MLSDERLAEIEAQMHRQNGPVVSLYRVDVEEMLAEIRRLRRSLHLSELSRGTPSVGEVG